MNGKLLKQVKKGAMWVGATTVAFTVGKLGYDFYKESVEPMLPETLRKYSEKI